MIFSIQVAKGAVPWRSIITSGPVWGIIVAAFASDWGLYVLLICVPLFLMDILHYEVAAVGEISETFPLYLLNIQTFVD